VRPAKKHLARRAGVASLRPPYVLVFAALSKNVGPPGWVAPAAVVAFVLACVVHYDMCRPLNLAVAWVFLVGFPPRGP